MTENTGPTRPAENCGRTAAFSRAFNAAERRARTEDEMTDGLLCQMAGPAAIAALEAAWPTILQHSTYAVRY